MQLTKSYNLFRIIILFAFGFLVGCIYMNCLWRIGTFLQISERKYALDMLYNQEHYKKFWELSFAILGTIVYLLTLFSGFTQLGNIFSYGFCVVFGIWWGAFLTECMIIKGISAIWHITEIVMPGTLIYMAAYVFCLIWSGNMSTSVVMKKKHQKNKQGKYGGILTISIFLFIFWIIWSFYVNSFGWPVLLEKIF